MDYVSYKGTAEHTKIYACATHNETAFICMAVSVSGGLASWLTDFWMQPVAGSGRLQDGF